MRNSIAISVAVLFLIAPYSSHAAPLEAVPSGIVRGYSVTSELEPSRNGQFSASIELRALDSNQFITRLHTQLASGKSTSFPLASHPGLEIRALAQGTGATSVRYVVEVFRLGILEARHEASVSVAPRTLASE